MPKPYYRLEGYLNLIETFPQRPECIRSYDKLPTLIADIREKIKSAEKSPLMVPKDGQVYRHEIGLMGHSY